MWYYITLQGEITRLSKEGGSGGYGLCPVKVPFSPGGLTVSSLCGGERYQSWMGRGKGNKEGSSSQLKNAEAHLVPTVGNWAILSCLASESQSGLG